MTQANKSLAQGSLNAPLNRPNVDELVIISALRHVRSPFRLKITN